MYIQLIPIFTHNTRLTLVTSDLGRYRTFIQVFQHLILGDTNGKRLRFSLLYSLGKKTLNFQYWKTQRILDLHTGFIFTSRITKTENERSLYGTKKLSSPHSPFINPYSLTGLHPGFFKRLIPPFVPHRDCLCRRPHSLSILNLTGSNQADRHGLLMCTIFHGPSYKTQHYTWCQYLKCKQ